MVDASPPGAALVAAAVATVVCALLLPGSAASGSTRVVTVRVDARDFSFALSRRSVPAGTTVRFVVRNRGATIHDFVLRKRRTRLLKPGQRQTIRITFPRKGAFRFKQVSDLERRRQGFRSKAKGLPD